VLLLECAQLLRVACDLAVRAPGDAGSRLGTRAGGVAAMCAAAFGVPRVGKQFTANPLPGGWLATRTRAGYKRLFPAGMGQHAPRAAGPDYCVQWMHTNSRRSHSDVN
jgi:hypothetical protein